MSVKKRYLTYDDTLLNSQVGAIVLLCATVFKISSLPGIVAGEFGSSTLWAYLIMSAVDIIVFGVAYAFFRSGGDKRLRGNNSIAYKAVMVLLTAFLCAKGAIYFCFSVNYLSTELFSSARIGIIIVCTLIPIIAFGLRGIKCLGRATELLLVPLFLLIMVNLVFVKADMDFGRNLPLLSAPPKELVSKFFEYGCWVGDLTPLLLISVKNRSMPWTGLCTATAVLLVNVVVMLGVAMYGDGLELVNNMLIKLGGFNQLSLEIGRIEWTALVVIAVAGSLEQSLLYWGAVESTERLFDGEKPRLVAKRIMQVAYPTALLAVALGVGELQKVIEFATNKYFGYTMFALAVFIPVAANIINAVALRKEKSAPTENGEPENGAKNDDKTNGDELGDGNKQNGNKINGEDNQKLKGENA